MKYLVRYFALLKEGLVTSKKAQFLLSFFVFISVYAISPYRICIVATPSIPTGVYLVNEFDRELKQGGIYCFDNPRPDWVAPELNIPSYQISCKYLLGVEGDSIDVADGIVRLTVTEYDPALGEHKFVHQFERIKSLRGAKVGFASLPKTIPEGEFYFGSDLKEGWDSRYLGLIKEDKIIGKATFLYAI